jgi:hypothetical protein
MHNEEYRQFLGWFLDLQKERKRNEMLIQTVIPGVILGMTVLGVLLLMLVG